MAPGKIFGILIFSSLAATGATLAGSISKNLANSNNLATSKNLASAKQVANVKADKVPLKGGGLGGGPPRLGRGSDRHGAQRQLASQNQAASRES